MLSILWLDGYSSHALYSSTQSGRDAASETELARNAFVVDPEVLFPSNPISGRGAVRLARLLWEQEVAGSNPVAPTKLTAETRRHGEISFGVARVFVV